MLANRVAALILAAGASARMGRPKQLLDWDGRALVRIAAEVALAAKLDPLLVVVGGAQAWATGGGASPGLLLYLSDTFR